MKDEAVDINGYQCRVISNHGRGQCIVLLHGFMLTSDVWNDIGLLRQLEKNSIPFKAIDMPYGQKSECAPKSNEPAVNAGIVAKVAPQDAVLIGASLGGYFALKHCVSQPASGLLLVAPVMSLQGDLATHYDSMMTKAEIIYGEADNVVHREEMKRLAKLLNVDLKIYEKARHAAYLDFPERFSQDVIDFYQRVTNHKS